MLSKYWALSAMSFRVQLKTVFHPWWAAVERLRRGDARER